MATCPNCGGQMSVSQIVCPHCGYDFPLQARTGTTQTAQKKGIAYSPLADFALAIGMLFTALGAIVSLIGIVVLTLSGHYATGLIQAPISFFMSLALFVVFQRVADMDDTPKQ